MEVCHDELFSNLFDSVEVAILTQGSLNMHYIKNGFSSPQLISRNCTMFILLVLLLPPQLARINYYSSDSKI